MSDVFFWHLDVVWEQTFLEDFVHETLFFGDFLGTETLLDDGDTGSSMVGTGFNFFIRRGRFSCLPVFT